MIKRFLYVLVCLLIAFPVLANTTTTNYGFNKPAVNDAVDEDIWGDYLNDNWDLLDTTLDGIESDIAAISPVPYGAVMVYGGTSAPTGWLLCYGQAVSRTTYSDLFTAIGTTYGVGDGSTTFNLPDIRGRVVAGQDDMGGSSANRLTDAVSESLNGDTLGDAGGAETHTLTVSQMPSHYHADGLPYANSSGNANGTTTISPSVGTRDSTSGGSDTAHPNTTATGGGGAHNNVQPTIILNYIIYSGV